jgi:hypothetical protein
MKVNSTETMIERINSALDTAHAKTGLIGRVVRLHPAGSVSVELAQETTAGQYSDLARLLHGLSWNRDGRILYF